MYCPSVYHWKIVPDIICSRITYIKYHQLYDHSWFCNRLVNFTSVFPQNVFSGWSRVSSSFFYMSLLKDTCSSWVHRLLCRFSVNVQLSYHWKNEAGIRDSWKYTAKYSSGITSLCFWPVLLWLHGTGAKFKVAYSNREL